MLKGEALKWYKSEVRSPERLKRRWTFLEVIYALQERFVHQATAQLASERFEGIKYNESIGVAGLANDLLKYAARMIERPDNYSLRKKFQQGLPNSIVVPLLRNQKVNAENSTFHQMVKEALDIENANKALEYHQRRREGTSSKTTRDNGTSGSRRKVTFTRSSEAGAGNGSVARPGNTPATAPSNATASTRPASSASRAGQRVPAEASASSPRGISDRSSIKCYRCGKMGHVRNSPLCPLNVNQNLLRMDEVEDIVPGDDDQTNGDGDVDVDEDLPLEGEQYDDDYPTEIFEEYPDSDDGPGIRSMQVVEVPDSDEEPMRMYGMSVTNEDDTNERLAAFAESKGQRTAMRVTSQAKPRPKLPTTCLVVYGAVNGLKGKILLDSGSSINAISPAFTAVAKLTAFPLEHPVGLQLGCVGSRSKINFGVEAAVTLGTVTHKAYFDVVNLDHYDMVIGILYMRTNSVTLDFGLGEVRVGKTRIPTVTPTESKARKEHSIRRGPAVVNTQPAEEPTSE